MILLRQVRCTLFSEKVKINEFSGCFPLLENFIRLKRIFLPLLGFQNFIGNVFKLNLLEGKKKKQFFKKKYHIYVVLIIEENDFNYGVATRLWNSNLIIPGMIFLKK